MVSDALNSVFQVRPQQRAPAAALPVPAPATLITASPVPASEPLPYALPTNLLPKINPDSPLVSVGALAASMGVSSCTLHRHTKKGWLKAVRIAGKNYITSASLKSFIARAESGEFARRTRRSIPKKSSPVPTSPQTVSN
jgi:hypothetical protein